MVFKGSQLDPESAIVYRTAPLDSCGDREDPGWATASRTCLKTVRPATTATPAGTSSASRAPVLKPVDCNDSTRNTNLRLRRSDSRFGGTTCRLDTDGEQTCNCPVGYQGRRCEQCSSGYTGNPLRGQPCEPPGSFCDPAGSLSLSPDPRTGQCQCKVGIPGLTKTVEIY